VILGDGYTSDDLAKYAADVNVLLRRLFLHEPFAHYASYFKVRRVDVASNESGVDHPARNVFRDTALGAAYDCEGIALLICVDVSAVLDVLGRSVPATARDIVVVIVNDAEYGGSGGYLAVTSTHDLAAEVLLHELGHSFGLLADEYWAGGLPCVNSVEPPQVNVTRESRAAAIKWSYWIEPGTPVPATGTTPGVVSAYEGAKYCESGLFRPTFDSRMRSVDKPFEQVNTEQLIKRIYNLVSPIDAVSPTITELQSDGCDSLHFSVRTPGDSGLAETLETAWYIDGGVAGRGNALTVFSCLLPVGMHRIEVEVRDVTPAVRRDPDGALVERFQWDLETSASTPSGFTDHPIVPRTTPVRAVHFLELRARIGVLRARAGLPAAPWTDPDLAAGVRVRRVHLTELRRALDAVYDARSLRRPQYTDTALGGVPLRAAHLMELRDAVLALE